VWLWTEERLQSSLADSALLKAEGNTYFTQKNWQNAIVVYQQALDVLPPPPVMDRKGKGRVAEEGSDDGESGESGEQQKRFSPDEESPQTENESEKEGSTSHQPLSPLQKVCSAARVVLFSNIAQCHIKLEEWQKAVDSCTKALLEDPHHQKSLWRRAKANEVLDSWSSLSSAQTDYQTLINTAPQGESLYLEAKKALKVLEPRVEEVKKRDIDKMMGQLKTVGDSVLGWFGMSTDNFKMTPNGQGGYSLNFENNSTSGTPDQS